MAPAFVSAAPVCARAASSSTSICAFDGMRRVATPALDVTVTVPAPGTPTMRCRRDLKKEKRQRNMEFSRVHRKRPVKHFHNRRSQQEAVNTADNDFLAEVYGTINFRADAEEEEGKNGPPQKGGKGPSK